MARKVKNPEMLIAEIHTQESKLKSLQGQFKLNQDKIARLSSTNESIKKKAHKLKEVLDQNKIRAKESGIQI